MAHINIEDTPCSKNPPRIKEKGILRYPQAYGSRPSTHLHQRNFDRCEMTKGRAQSHQTSQTKVPKTKIQVKVETYTPTSEKGKYREGTKVESIMEESPYLNISNYQSDRLSWSLASVSPDPGADSRREIFRRKLAKAANAENFAIGENKKSGDSYVQDIHIRTWDIDPPTSARSSGTLELDAGTWRDFAYRDPWPELPGITPLLSPDGFGKFFPSPESESPESGLESPFTLAAPGAFRETNNSQPLDGERRMGNEIFSDPRTANKVDRWLRDYPYRISRINPRRSLLKQIFEDPDEVKLLRDILALVDFHRIYKKNGLRHKSTKVFIKFYRKNAEIVLSRFRRQIKYKENLIPSLDELNDFKRWREECAPWRTHYDSQDIMSLQSLQRDVNSLARTYYSIQVKEDPEIKFIPIYRAFYQLELYCQLFRISKFTTPETSGDRLEKMKRIFFERYMPYETSLIFKITRWILREWYAIDRLCDRNVRDKAQTRLNKKENDNFHHRRYLGISFFAELLYSDTATQTALIDENRWQLKMIRFTWRTTCWAAQDQDEKGNVIFIDDQELMEKSNDTEMKKRLFGSWTRLPM
ncbi:hypothetical protein OnM2_052048 [Erysiphe neolycopersici]|uniref:Uncharacterized protein n=1 Tax=Erysiphe neolycopersici TaxID=212602 RepID=A0A420HS36_9PEZI|nr:hypothetical protein OnM2_052048 [Erysiphe neolycopersici]